MNWFQISKEIPSSLVIMSHREWDSGKDEIGEKGGKSQTSVTCRVWEMGGDPGDGGPLGGTMVGVDGTAGVEWTVGTRVVLESSS